MRDDEKLHEQVKNGPLTFSVLQVTNLNELRNESQRKFVSVCFYQDDVEVKIFTKKISKMFDYGKMNAGKSE